MRGPQSDHSASQEWCEQSVVWAGNAVQPKRPLSLPSDADAHPVDDLVHSDRHGGELMTNEGTLVCKLRGRVRAILTLDHETQPLLCSGSFLIIVGIIITGGPLHIIAAAPGG